MMRRARGEQGQTAAELMGALLLVAVIVAALVGGGLPGRVADGAASAVCTIAGQDCDAGARPASAPADDDGSLPPAADPATADFDEDGIPDLQELEPGSGLDPLKADADDDGLSDAEEVAAETDPGEADGDGEGGAIGDGLSDAEELERGTDPNAYDTDGDGWSDGHEVREGDDPLKDERNVVEKAFDTLVLDDPISAVLPGGGAGKGAKKVVDDLLGGGRKGAKRIGGAETVDDAARIRRERVDEVRKARRDRPVAPAKRDSGETVIGPYPDYIDLANARNARRFGIPDEVWGRMTDAQRWEANQKFLDRTVTRGDEVVLATSRTKIREESYLRKEVDYLLSKGYTWSDDGTRLLPPGP